MYKIFGLNFALHWHGGVGYEQGRSQFGTVLFEGLLLKVPTFIRMKLHMVSCDKRSFLISHTALLTDI